MMHIEEINPDGQSLFNHSNSTPFEIEQQSKASSLLDGEMQRRIEKELRESLEQALVKRTQEVMAQAIHRLDCHAQDKIAQINSAYAAQFIDIKKEID